MIRYLKRLELNDQKYDACIKNSLNTRVYAYSWYLDIVATNWDALVLNDYEVVMPLPWRSKYFIKYIYPPSWTQQLGLFSTERIEAELVQRFLKNIPKKFKKVTIQFNSGNPVEGMVKKTNCLLNLNSSYNVILKNYRKDRRKSLKKAQANNLYFKDDKDYSNLIELYDESFPDLNFKREEFVKLGELIKYCFINNYGFQRNIFENNCLVAGAFFLNYNNTVYYLFGASNIRGKRNGATSFMIDSVLKKYAETETIFDFEGSSIASIFSFYNSFGGEIEEYNVYRNSFSLF